MINCRSCNKPFSRPVQRGRPAVRCPECRSKDTTSAVSTEVIEESGIEESSAPAKEQPKEDTHTYLYRLMVGNMVGVAYAGDSEKEAMTAFDSYSKKSSMGFGQVGFEVVQLWKLNRDTNSYELEKDFRPIKGYE